MPTRREVFYNGGIYHVFNKTIDKKRVFATEMLCKRFLELIRYYRSIHATLRYSHFNEFTQELKDQWWKLLENPRRFKINILSYCLIPNHFHFLVKQKKEKGVEKFMSDIINSCTRFYNLISERKGPLFLPRFQSRAIVSREQLIHVSRYIHLNPYSNGLVNELEAVKTYSWSSLKEYTNPESTNKLCNTEIILNQFQNNRKKYLRFVLDNAYHQRTLEYIKQRDK